MYLPSHFEEQRAEEIQRLIQAYPLGSLVVQGPDGLMANHLPFLFDPQVGAHGRLLAHIARANPLWRDCADGAEALVLFRGADAYISPNWYPSKHETHRQLPTWNYQVVNVHGLLKIRDEESFVRGLVARLTHPRIRNG
ncbi:MAG: FMN-binding negative transcriptional regulator [Gammaproteobacteria bacterium]